jgi:hypothetical protein
VPVPLHVLTQAMSRTCPARGRLGLGCKEGTRKGERRESGRGTHYKVGRH